MASVYKRPQDKARGKLGKWTCSYKDAAGKFRSRAGTTDKAESEKMASRLESDAALVRAGLVDPVVATRRDHARAPLAAHLAAFGDHLRAKGDSAPYCRRVPPAVGRLLALAGIEALDQLNAPAVQGALGKMRQAGDSARTCNLALSLFKAFVGWLEEAGRIDAPPRGMKSLSRFNEAADRRRVRRALTMAEVDRLLAAVEAGPPRKLSRIGCQFAERWMSGPERGALYRLALGTGFRVDELRSLRPGAFHLDGPEPTVTLAAAAEKSGRGTVQPITVDLAAQLRPFIQAKPADEPILPVPARMADFIRRDLSLAGIPYETAEGVVDFHAIRHSFITHLVASGANPKVAQVLARHSTITLTMDRYAHADRSALRSALKGR